MQRIDLLITSQKLGTNCPKFIWRFRIIGLAADFRDSVPRVFEKLRLFKQITVFMLCLLVTSCLYANDAVQILQHKLNNFRSMQANFRQVVFSADGEVLQKSRGKIAIQRPGKFRWETTRNIKQLIVTDGNKIWIYDPDLQQVTIKKISDKFAATPVLLLISADANLANSFMVTQLSSKSDVQIFQLQPKNKTEDFSSVTIKFQADKVKQMNFVNKLGQQTKLYFSRVILNRNIPNVFTFIIPQGVDVIDETKSG